MNLTNHNCCQEGRIAHIEAEISEINVRLDTKKEDIHQLEEDRLAQQKLMTDLIEKVTRVTVLLEEGQKTRKDNKEKLGCLERKIDSLQKELGDNKSDVTELTSSLRSFRNTFLAAIPIVSILVGVILHYI